MKKIAGLIALFALAAAEHVFAFAVATSVSGTVSAQVGTGTPRTVRVGDRLNQGDTVVTGPNSSAVMKFEDGQVAAMTANSRMTITSYNYEPASKRGNSLLSLVSGGMRFVTGLIGKSNPRSVSLRAATATIGIRGTQLSVATMSGVTIAEVSEGVIEFTIGDKSVTVNVGEAALVLPDGKLSKDTVQNIYNQLNSTGLGKEILNALQGLNGLTSLIQQASPGTPIQGEGGAEGGGTGATGTTPSGSTGTGGAGGGGVGSPS